jgi:hypothetical protein
LGKRSGLIVRARERATGRFIEKEKTATVITMAMNTTVALAG